MRTMLAVTCAVLAAQGCKSQKVLAVEMEVAAAKGRLAALEQKRQELLTESRRLQVERKTFSQQADEAALARERLNAAARVLAGLPIPDGLLLDEALRTKSPQLGALAAEIIQRQLPCADPEAEAEDDSGGPDCMPPPLEDACEGVSARAPQSIKWACPAVVAAAKAPPVAVCLGLAELDEASYPISAPTEHLAADAVRLAYEKGGRLLVADWPPPGLDLYEPANWSELASCAATNAHEQCVRGCDEKNGRLHGDCDDWAGDGYEGEGGEGDDAEPSELRAAREAAEREEREAEEARNELSYQECLAGCGGDEEEEPEPVARVALSYARSPAPGLFEFNVDIEQEDGGFPDRSVLISFPALHEELAGKGAVPEEDTVLGLVTVLDVEKVIEGKVNDGKRILAGITPEGFPVAARVSMDGKAAPVDLELEEVCAFAEQVKNTKLSERCGVAKAQREEARLRAAAKAADGGVDAGVDGGVDAGVKP